LHIGLKVLMEVANEASAHGIAPTTGGIRADVPGTRHRSDACETASTFSPIFSTSETLDPHSVLSPPDDEVVWHDEIGVDHDGNLAEAHRRVEAI
jgi:hypothetical protein